MADWSFTFRNNGSPTIISCYLKFTRFLIKFNMALASSYIHSRFVTIEGRSLFVSIRSIRHCTRISLKISLNVAQYLQNSEMHWKRNLLSMSSRWVMWRLLQMVRPRNSSSILMMINISSASLCDTSLVVILSVFLVRRAVLWRVLFVLLVSSDCFVISLSGKLSSR